MGDARGQLVSLSEPQSDFGVVRDFARSGSLTTLFLARSGGDSCDSLFRVRHLWYSSKVWIFVATVFVNTSCLHSRLPLFYVETQ